MKIHPAEKKSSGMFLRALTITTIVAFLALVVVVFLRDGGAPVLKLTPKTDSASYTTEFTLSMSSSRAGLKECIVTAAQDGKRVEVVHKNYPAKQLEQAETFQLPRDAGFKEGPLELSVVVRDNALLSFIGRGKSSLVQNLTLDFSPPRISVIPGTHNVNQGGAAVVGYTVTKPVERTGVAVGQYFFQAYQQPGGEWVCYFAMPHTMQPGDFKPKVIARDKAGNEAAVSVNVLAIPKLFKFDKLNIPDEFLNSKMSQYTTLYPAEKSPLDIYKRVNTELRKQNEAHLFKVAQNTSATPLWSGPFLRLPNSAGRANFGDQRDYYYQGEKIDHQTHMGVDLASVANAPVPAANAGRIVLAEFFGIYGNCVIIDHGLGLQSLYSHLDEISVAMNAVVKKGDVIGKTGTTGLAGGDHLHFGMMVGGLQVSPIEWWDDHWIKDNILSHLKK